MNRIAALLIASIAIAAPARAQEVRVPAEVAMSWGDFTAAAAVGLFREKQLTPAPSGSVANVRIVNSNNGSVFIGKSAGNANQSESGTDVVAIGYLAGSSLTSSSDVIAIGRSAYGLGTTLSDTIAIGSLAGYGGGGGNVWIGVEAGYNNVSPGTENVGVGKQVLYNMVAANKNAAIGRTALFDVTTANGSDTLNSAFGYGSGRGVTTGAKNTFVGAQCNVGNVSNNVVLCDGDGNDRIWVNATGHTTTQGAVVPFYTVGTITTAGAATYTAANLLGGMILRNPNGGNRSDVTPTAALLVAALPNAIVGSGFEFVIRNTATAAETITVTAGTGATLSGTMTIAQNNSKRFLLVFTNVTASSEAYTLYSLGTSVH